MIQLHGIRKAYGGQQVLDNLELKFAAGRVTGIMGKNGAGKTTLFRCLAGLENFEGRITPTTELREITAYLPTDPPIMTYITGKEYLRLIANARSVTCDNLSSRNIFNLPLERFASRYSTGMKKKLAITGLLLSSYDIYLLDEPFNGVDMESNLLITQLIVKLKELGKTVIISSHMLASLRECCDKIYVLEDGKIELGYACENFSQLSSTLSSKDEDHEIANLDL